MWHLGLAFAVVEAESGDRKVNSTTHSGVRSLNSRYVLPLWLAVVIGPCLVGPKKKRGLRLWVARMKQRLRGYDDWAKDQHMYSYNRLACHLKLGM